jgi:hypothetical protein
VTVQEGRELVLFGVGRRKERRWWWVGGGE